MRLRISLGFTALLFATACTDTIEGTGANGDSDGTNNGDGDGVTRVALSNVEHVCELLVDQCQLAPVTYADCVSYYGAVRVSQSCADKLEAATCDDIADARTFCFPACSGGKGSCNDDDSVTVCTDGVNVTLDCEAACNVSGRTWTGSCGLEHPTTGETSQINDCWCQ